MAKRAVQSISSNRVRRQTKQLLPESNVGRTREIFAGINFKRLLKKVRGNSLLLNTGIGVGSFFLVRYAIRYYKDHPEISEYIKDNLDTVESKFREYKSSMMGESENTEDARH